MTIEQLRRMHQARPFLPFRVHMADGRHLDVEHPEFLAHTPSGRTVMIARPDEAFEIVDLLLVTSLEPTDGNSRRRRRRES
jgi:hypothetical protein